MLLLITIMAIGFALGYWIRMDYQTAERKYLSKRLDLLDKMFIEQRQRYGEIIKHLNKKLLATRSHNWKEPSNFMGN